MGVVKAPEIVINWNQIDVDYENEQEEIDFMSFIPQGQSMYIMNIPPYSLPPGKSYMLELGVYDQLDPMSVFTDVLNITIVEATLKIQI